MPQNRLVTGYGVELDPRADKRPRGPPAPEFPCPEAARSWRPGWRPAQVPAAGSGKGGRPGEAAWLGSSLGSRYLEPSTGQD